MTLPSQSVDVTALKESSSKHYDDSAPSVSDNCVLISFQGGMINWNRLFPPLRQRQNVNYQGGRQSEPAAPPLEVSEEQVINQ